MKKFFLLSFIAVAIGISSCDNKEKCWEVKYKIGGAQHTQYVFDTKSNVEGRYRNNSDYPDVSINEVKKSQIDCLIANNP